MTELSICILTLNSKDYLRQCLNSIRQYPPKEEYEILVADNGSTDGTTAMLYEKFPEVQVILNKENLGFTKPNNQMLHLAKGDFLLLLNPDTLLIEDCFNPQVEYLRANPEVGVSIPKVLNGDGTFQRQSRRGEATPIEVFGYVLKLGKIFPKNKKLNGYLLSWLSEDEIAEVKAVSGSCMFIRRQAWEQVGDFDEQFFAYQEDSDYCMRARQKGWRVMYVPISRIIHYGGEGGSKDQPVNSIVQWHRSYYLYYRKHFAKDRFFLFNWFFYLSMAGKLGIALLAHLFSPR
ncbi:MAG: glycosyltransferase family 2 protein [Anaerolineaceae bacterium]|nr:glycosyltransferase family 2 protein [Anaerolineaceae bacterium]MDD4043642.1 glycosyltransferase family 2 protein [Anaerolineaceae bacterium]MDD4577585.1 glycosyltransferase family 2 protein [Anaerolineaceae bacterium]